MAFYKVKCNTTDATVSANMNIVNVETGALLYGDSMTKSYNGDSCKAGTFNLGLIKLKGAPGKILSKRQAINKLTEDIANEFVRKLTPRYVSFKVTLLDSIELDNVTDSQKQALENSLAYIKAGRMKKSEKILGKLLDELDGKSYAVAYDLGVVKEAQGKLDEAKKLYVLADELASKPVDEINAAMVRIDSSIAKREEARKQMNAK